MNSALQPILTLIDQLRADEFDALIRELASPECARLGVDRRDAWRSFLVGELESELESELDVAQKRVRELKELEKSTDDDDGDVLQDLNDALSDMYAVERSLDAVRRVRQQPFTDAKTQTLIREAVERAQTEAGRKAKQKTKRDLTAILTLLAEGLSFPQVNKKLKMSARWAEGRLREYRLMSLVEKLRNNRRGR